MQSGPIYSPAEAQSAPDSPWKRRPIITAALPTLGPGSTWPRPSTSAYSRSVSQRRSSTMMRRAQAATPPKPNNPALA